MAGRPIIERVFSEKASATGLESPTHGLLEITAGGEWKTHLQTTVMAAEDSTLSTDCQGRRSTYLRRGLLLPSTSQCENGGKANPLLQPTMRVLRGPRTRWEKPRQLKSFGDPSLGDQCGGFSGHGPQQPMGKLLVVRLKTLGCLDGNPPVPRQRGLKLQPRKMSSPKRRSKPLKQRGE